MAIKTIQGVGGSCVLPAGFNGKFNQFTVDLDLHEVDTTGFVDVGWFTHEVTFMDFTGTARATMQFDDTNSTPVPATLMGATPALGAAGGSNVAAGTITLTWQTGCTWTFAGVVTKFGGSRPAVDKAESNYTFRHQSGGIAQVWDVTP